MATSYPGAVQVIQEQILMIMFVVFNVNLWWVVILIVSLGFFQVGSYFVTQYYQVLQQQPELVHQFYSDNSTMVRVDGESRDSASSMMVLYLPVKYISSVVYVYSRNISLIQYMI